MAVLFSCVKNHVALFERVIFLVVIDRFVALTGFDKTFASKVIVRVVST
jgi:hypothetical protein